jgi:hypothetical protein
MSDNGTEAALKEAWTVIRAEEETRKLACAKEIDAVCEKFNCQLIVRLSAPAQQDPQGNIMLMPVPVVTANPLQISQEETEDQKSDS